MASDLTALDVAVLPPAHVVARALEVSAFLPSAEAEGLRLDATHLPHITLIQLFVRSEELEPVFRHIDELVAAMPPLRLRVTGAEVSGTTVSMAVEPTPPLVTLHEQLMHSLHGLERPDGGRSAFADDDARVGDVLWVASYRLKSSFGAYTPHITLGHAKEAPQIESFEFEGDTIAACHLGRFCTCRHVLREWTLAPTSSL